MKFLAAILLVVGTTIGAGLLALPMVTVRSGLLTSIAYMIFMCLYMLIPAFYVVHVMMAQPKGSHLVTMARATLGTGGVILLWISNCFLLYAILAAYISAGGDLVANFIAQHAMVIPVEIQKTAGAASTPAAVALGSVIFTAVMALFVIPGIRVTGLANSVFMTFKAVFFVLLIGILLFHVHGNLEWNENIVELKKTVLVGVASFSYAMIIPSIFAYLDFDVKQLKKAMIVGTLVSFIIYMIWITSVRLVIPLHGANGLLRLADQGSVYYLAKSIGIYTAFAKANVIADSFVSVCLLTTFLGVSICLSDVIADGLRVRKRGLWGILVYALTYLPPVILVLFFPKIFIIGVNYAGLLCLVYLVILPSLMMYSARFHKKILPVKLHSFFNSRAVIISWLLIAALLFTVGLINIVETS